MATPIVLLSTVLAADLPVREVVLYKNGVAFFERGGDLKAGEAARLDFKAAEMNDLLKSLTVNDAAGGKVTAVRYDSAEPVDRKLAEFSFQVGLNQPLSSFFDHMKGSQVTLKYGAESITGTVLGARLTAGPPEKEQLTLVLDSGELRNLDLGGATNIKFTDPAVERQLKAYLLVLAQSRSMDRRSVYIDSATAAARKISASYMIPAPVWKSSYRLILAEREPMLEGWAIVDNTTADDWTGIRLSLVSGRPVSFISRLYEPRYRQRPYGDLAEEASVGPRVYDGGVVGGIIGSPANAPAPPPAVDALASRAGNSQRLEQFAKMQKPKSVTNSTAEVATAGREIGELFEYGFSTPVTIKRGESAMLPFLQEKITSRKLLIFSDDSGINPMNAAEITNSTGKTLDGGPITVYDGGSYAGEALVETLKAGDKRLISYAVDLGTRVSTNIDSERELIREIHFNRGVLTTKTAQQENRVYTIKNVDGKGKTLIIEHPIRNGYKLMSAKPAETTSHSYRFEVKLGTGAEVKFPVMEELVYENSTSINNQAPDFLVGYLQNKALSEAGKRALTAILDRKREIAAADSEINRLTAETNEITSDQNRLRQNISSLNQVSGQDQQVRQYSQQLAQGETKIVTMRDQMNQQRRKKQALQSALNDMIEKTVF